ncbi:MAG: lytic transglycosylase domain-containing protein, partial [Bacteroidota bacterium]
MRSTDAQADYIMETTDSLVRARLSLLDSNIMDHRLDDAVRRRIVNYLENWPITSRRLLARSVRFFPIFEKQLLAAGMPLGLKYVTIQESALRPFATSHAGAVGLWQLMPGTAREHGLTVNDILDERLDPELGCAAGLEYLQLQYDRYEDWSLALAAYNCGPGNVNRALRRSRGKQDYWSIRRYLPRETRNYLPNIIAATYLMVFHHEHGVAASPMELDLQITEAITVYRKLSLWRVAQVTGLRPEVVIRLNAQYLKGYLPGMPGGHRLRLPRRVMPAMREYL